MFNTNCKCFNFQNKDKGNTNTATNIRFHNWLTEEVDDIFFFRNKTTKGGRYHKQITNIPQRAKKPFVKRHVIHTPKIYQE